MNRPYLKSEPAGAVWLKAFGILLIIQIVLGGMMSGMHAALSYPTWPDMRGVFMPAVVFPGNWSLEAFANYDTDPNLVAQSVIQFFHRMTAYALTIVGIIFFFKTRNITDDRWLKTSLIALPVVILVQVMLRNPHDRSKVSEVFRSNLGVYHQAGAIILLALTTFIYFHYKRNVSASLSRFSFSDRLQ